MEKSFVSFLNLLTLAGAVGLYFAPNILAGFLGSFFTIIAIGTAYQDAKNKQWILVLFNCLLAFWCIFACYYASHVVESSLRSLRGF